eukprot:1137883-Pelagomonas_calceolata.AAC.5
MNERAEMYKPEEAPPGTFFYSQASSKDVFHSLQEQTNEIYRFISDLMDIVCAVGTAEQAEQPNYLAEGQTP